MRCRSSTAGGVLTKLIVLVALVGMVLGGGLFAWSRMRGGAAEAADAGGEAPDSEQAEATEEDVLTQTLELGEFLVNLQSGDGTLRYLQTEVSLVVEAPEEESAGSHGGGHGGGDAQAELPPASQRYARDVAIEVLSSQSFEKLRREPDRSQLKELLRQRIDEALQDYRVMDVLFTAFVMQ